MLKDQIDNLIVQTNMFKLHIKVDGRNLSIGMTFIESRAPITGSTLRYDPVRRDLRFAPTPNNRDFRFTTTGKILRI